MHRSQIPHQIQNCHSLWDLGVSQIQQNTNLQQRMHQQDRQLSIYAESRQTRY